MKMNASVGQGRRAIPQRRKACATPPGSGRLLAGLLALLGAAIVPQLHADAYHDSVVIVLDASGSMDGRLKGVEMTKMDGAKAALRTVLSQVPTSTHIGLLVFSGSNVGNDWVYPLGPRDDVRLLTAIDQPRPYGHTPLGRYLKLGADRLLEERQKQFGYGSYRLLVVTDGEAQDQELVDRLHPRSNGAWHHGGRHRRGHEARPHSGAKGAFLPPRQRSGLAAARRGGSDGGGFPVARGRRP